MSLDDTYKTDTQVPTFSKELDSEDRANIESYISHELKESVKFIQWAAKYKSKSKKIIAERILILTHFRLITIEVTNNNIKIIRRNFHLFSLQTLVIKDTIVTIAFNSKTDTLAPTSESNTVDNNEFHNRNVEKKTAAQSYLFNTDTSAMLFVHSVFSSAVNVMMGNVNRVIFTGTYNSVPISNSSLGNAYSYSSSRKDSFLQCFHAACNYYSVTATAACMSSIISIISTDPLIFNINSINDFDAEIYKCLMKTLSYDSIIRILYVKGVNIGDESVSYLLNMLQENKSIELLKLNNIGITFLFGDKFGKIFSSKFHNLHSLDLSQNHIGDNAIIDLCYGLKDYKTSFRYLNLSSCDLTSVGLCALSKTFSILNPSLCSYLSYLDLSDNSFDKKASLMLCDWLNILSKPQIDDSGPEIAQSDSGKNSFSVPPSPALQLNTFFKKRGSFATVTERINLSVHSSPHTRSRYNTHRGSYFKQMYSNKQELKPESKTTLKFLILSNCNVDISILISKLLKLPSIKLETLDLSHTTIPDISGLLMVEYFATVLASSAFYLNLEGSIIRPSVFEAIIAALLYRQTHRTDVPVTPISQDGSPIDHSQTGKTIYESSSSNPLQLRVNTNSRVTAALCLASPRISRPGLELKSRTLNTALTNLDIQPESPVEQPLTPRRRFSTSSRTQSILQKNNQRLIFNFNNVGVNNNSFFHIISLLSTASISLKSLLFNKIDISKQCTELLLKTLTNLPALETFCFDFNIWKDDADDSMASAIESLVNDSRSLKCLSLRGNWKSGYSAPVIKLLDSLILNSSFHLTRLDISGNGLGPAVVESLSRVMAHNTTLKELHWDNNLTSSHSHYIKSYNAFFRTFFTNTTLMIMSLPFYDVSRMKSKKVENENEKLDQMLDKMKDHIENNRKNGISNGSFMILQSPFSYDIYTTSGNINISEYRHIDLNIEI